MKIRFHVGAIEYDMMTGKFSCTVIGVVAANVHISETAEADSHTEAFIKAMNTVIANPMLHKDKA